ncbi:hypothetical protein EJB05_55684, partial [Eragrostis curvula]
MIHHAPAVEVLPLNPTTLAIQSDQPSVSAQPMPTDAQPETSSVKTGQLIVICNDCVLCQSPPEEDLEHLFFSCTFSRWCWNLLNLQWNRALSVEDRIEHLCNQNNLCFIKELVIVACWAIWKHRNAIIFDNKNVSLQNWKREFKEEMALTVIKAKGQKKREMKIWLDSF